MSLGIAGYILLRPRPLIDGQARDLLTKELRGDGPAVFAYVSDRQVLKYGLNEQKVQRLYDVLITPRLASFHQIGAMGSRASDDLSQGVAWVTIGDEKGNTFEVISSPWATDTGCTTDVTFFLYNAWLAEFVVSRGLPVTQATITYSRIRGIDADLATLHELGIYGHVDEFGKVDKKWEDVRDLMVRRLKLRYAAEAEKLHLDY